VGDAAECSQYVQFICVERGQRGQGSTNDTSGTQKGAMLVQARENEEQAAQAFQ